ncbi:Yip1 domain protein [Leptospira broomii serovar Hurstbridge str. 5399]|uniref:Yip1 domain protein n=1 Tax=Leptospira broomii serovar Hurstbridge str. 5399 TaxID=1049789 RepID=T0EX14_9LEPT|nr:YIP1 family protein [Leptospira broomii]EQA43435.1 Yip1 domain protein [Leptospira broomii serovar Hurstbridge str. 5399]
MKFLKIYSEAFQENWRYSIRPETILEISPATFLLHTLRIQGLYFGTYVVFNMLVSFANWKKVQSFSSVMRTYYNEGKISFSMFLFNVFPWNLFTLVFSFLLAMLIAGSLSHLFLWLLGEERKSYFRILGITAFSNFYILLSFFPILLLFNIAPGSFRQDTFKLVFFLSLNGIFLLAGFLLQAILFVRGLKSCFGLNTGKAVLTWSFPLVLFAFLITISLK